MRAVYIFLIVIGAALVVWLGWTFYVRFSFEKLGHRVIEKRDGFEIRLQGPHIAACVDMPGDHETAINQGFQILAGYIFGGNTGKESISMTAPVTESVSERIAMTAPVTEQATGELRRITFMMPAKFTLTTLPRPNDSRIYFEEVPARKIAAISFTWYPNQARVERKKKELDSAVRSAGFTPKSAPVYAGYSDPYSFPLLQRHEIMIEIE